MTAATLAGEGFLPVCWVKGGLAVRRKKGKCSRENVVSTSALFNPIQSKYFPDKQRSVKYTSYPS
jgi:hypothetical protein